MGVVEGLSHITFIVRDLDRVEHLLTEVLGAEKVYDSGTATFSLPREQFFLIGGVWIAVMEGEPPPARTHNHVAFRIDETDYLACLVRIRALGHCR